MPDPKEGETITESFDHWIEVTGPAINLTGIPDDQFRSVDDDGNPIVETESMDRPMINFDDLPLWTGREDEHGQASAPGANGAGHPAVPPGVPPKSV